MKQQRAAMRARTRARATEFFIRAALLIAAYFCAGRLGMLLALPHDGVTPFWPASGIAVAALLMFGRRYWPALLAGAFLLEATAGRSTAVAVGLAAGTTLEYAFAAVLLERIGFVRSMRRTRDVLMLAVAGALLCPLVAAAIGTAALFFGGIIAGSDIERVGIVSLVGDGVGILVFAPFVLAWSEVPREWPTRRQIFEIVLLALATAGFSSIVFLGAIPLAYLAFPLASVAAIRFGLRGATTMSLAVSVVAVIGASHGVGPFNEGSEAARMTSLQIYLAGFTLTSLTLAATVAARKDAEHAVAEHAARIEESNRELEAFAYTIAHDLRAPLRAINGYSETVIEDYASDLPAEASRSLEKIATNAVGMGRLIDALLDFARLGSKRIARTALRPGTVAKAALERLRTVSPEGDVAITIAETPPCLADPTLLGLVYQNLIDNALKFTRERAAATIDVGWVPSSGDSEVPVYYVRDNGIGFDMRYGDRIFGVFQRLHRESDYPGTGAGLAIVKRIVNRHGGSVWVHAESDRGATFFFTLRARGRG